MTGCYLLMMFKEVKSYLMTTEKIMDYDTINMGKKEKSKIFLFLRFQACLNFKTVLLLLQ